MAKKNAALTMVVPGLDSQVVRQLNGVSLTVGELKMLAMFPPAEQAAKATAFLTLRKQAQDNKPAKQAHFSVDLYTNKEGETIGVILRGPKTGWRGLFLTFDQIEVIASNLEVIRGVAAKRPAKA